MLLIIIFLFKYLFFFIYIDSLFFVLCSFKNIQETTKESSVTILKSFFLSIYKNSLKVRCVIYIMQFTYVYLHYLHYESRQCVH